MLNCWCITWPVGFKKLIFLHHNIEQNNGPEDNKWERHQNFSWGLGVIGGMKLKLALKKIGSGVDVGANGLEYGPEVGLWEHGDVFKVP
jgi:hypothetical protein